MYTGAQGARKQLNQRHFYEKLATELVDNFYDRPFSRLSSSDAGPNSGDSPKERRIGRGSGIHLTPTWEKHKTKGTVVTKYALQGACHVAKSERQRIYALPALETLVLCGFATQ